MRSCVPVTWKSPWKGKPPPWIPHNKVATTGRRPPASGPNAAQLAWHRSRELAPDEVGTLVISTFRDHIVDAQTDKVRLDCSKLIREVRKLVARHLHGGKHGGLTHAPCPTAPKTEVLSSTCCGNVLRDRVVARNPCEAVAHMLPKLPPRRSKYRSSIAQEARRNGDQNEDAKRASLQ